MSSCLLFHLPYFTLFIPGAANPNWKELNYHPEETVGKGKARSAEEERKAHEIDRLLRDKVDYFLFHFLSSFFTNNFFSTVYCAQLFFVLFWHNSSLRCFCHCVFVTDVLSFSLFNFIPVGVLSQCVQQSDGGKFCGRADLR